MAKETNIPEVYWRLAGKISNPDENLRDFPPAVKILQRLLTLPQAEMSDLFPAVPEELATKTGRSLKDIKKDLDYMYRLGLGTPSARTGRWNIPRNPMLFMDKLATHHRNSKIPFRELLHELNEARYQKLLERRAKASSKGPSADEVEEVAARGNRIIPEYLSVKDKPELQPWESMKGLLQLASHIVVVDCPCRMRTKSRGTCVMGKETEICFLLNRDAEYAVDSGSASRFLMLEEAMKHVERVEKAGTVHQVGNYRGIASLLCNCCNDHCMGIERWYREGKPKDNRITPSRWLPVVDTSKCQGHGVCVERCFFDAITRKRDVNGQLKAVIDPEMCVGCGSCVIGCPVEGAMDMKCVRPESFVPSGMHHRPGESRDYPQYENL